MDPRHAYPRPQLRRHGWTLRPGSAQASLNGAWQFALDPEARWRLPADVAWDAAIEVPFSPETPASGIGDTGMYNACWYRREFGAPPLSSGERLLLHFGAVDWAATVWVNGELAARHAGGYTPFSADITSLLVPGPQMVVVRAEDNPRDLGQPRGKQDWLPQPHAIWYPRTTGIWQTVWLERVPAAAITTLRWRSDVGRREIGLAVEIDGERREGLRLRVVLRLGERALVDETHTAPGRDAPPGTDAPPGRLYSLPHSEDLLWSPERPALIDARIQLLDPDGQIVDDVESYTALRSVGVEDGRFLLNGHPYYLRLVLDQGYWPESGLTAPDDHALRRDVELAKAMGFNGVRKHQKIEDPRYLYWADRLGLLVWQEMPSAYQFTPDAVRRTTAQWLEAVERDRNHPCVVARVPFNESWGVHYIAESEAERDYVRNVYGLTKALDPSRPVIGNDGWETPAGDIIGIHDYQQSPQRLADRYRDIGDVSAFLDRERVDGHRLALDGAYTGQPLMLTEFGGLAFAKDAAQTWGYSVCQTPGELAQRYAALLEAVRSVSLFAGFCYTQFADTYQEANGLVYADRTPKFATEEIARPTRGD